MLDGTDQADRVKKPIAQRCVRRDQTYVLALSRSLQHELANKGLRIPALLLGATETEI